MQQRNSDQPMSIEQKIELGANIAYTVCFPVMVLLRRRLGYRFISQPRLLIAAFFFWIAATFVATPSSSSFESAPSGGASNVWLIFLFSFAFLIWGFVQRSLRWRELKRGVSWHTRSRGISWFIFLPLSDSAIKRFVDPLVTFLIGLILALSHLQQFLGVYLIVAAVCMFAWEAYDYERSLNLMLDQLDALVDSQVISENVEYYSQGAPGQIKQRALDETAGIPTGIAPDLAAAIARRQASPVPVGSPTPQPQTP